MYYAEIDISGICKNILNTPNNIEADHMVEIPEYDMSYIGQIYNRETGIWSPGPAAPAPSPTLEEKVDAMGKILVQLALK